MGPTVLPVPSLTENFVPLCDHSPDQWIGRDAPPAPERELQSTLHVHHVRAGTHSDKRAPKLPNHVPERGSKRLPVGA
jgi:hypothetical protein